MTPNPKPGLLVGRSVLVADDEADIRSLIVTTFEAMGCTSVLQAADGGEAQSALERSVDDLDLVVCDWIMPQLTGLHLLNWTRNRKPDLPFMIVTGMNEVTSVVDAVASGVTGYVLKPFGPDRLEEKVCEILKR